MTPQGDIFLVDSGLQGLGVRPHTPGYGSPEQQAQGAVGPSSDIYSLGATLYTLLTGVVPANALSRESGLSDLKSPREVNPDIEPYLSIVAMRALVAAAGRALSIQPRSLAMPWNGPPVDPRRKSAPDGARPKRPRPRRRPLPQRRACPTRSRMQIQQRTLIGLSALLVGVLGLIAWLIFFNPEDLLSSAGPEATETVQSAIIIALTDLAPTATRDTGADARAHAGTGAVHHHHRLAHDLRARQHLSHRRRHQ